jgi:hypothetical protein
MPVDRQFLKSPREREARTRLAQARVRADTPIPGLIFPDVAKLSQLVGRNSGSGGLELAALTRRRRAPGPRIVAPNGATPNREGQALWLPAGSLATGSAGRPLETTGSRYADVLGDHVPSLIVMPRGSGVSSTLRLRDSISDGCGILGHPLSRVMTTVAVPKTLQPPAAYSRP